MMQRESDVSRYRKKLVTNTKKERNGHDDRPRSVLTRTCGGRFVNVADRVDRRSNASS
jgi:hypothetical protein